MSKWDYIVEEMRLEDDWLLLESKDRLIDRLPSLDDAQKARMKRFFAKRPNLESKFDWNRPETITWDAFQSIANGYEDPIDPDTVPEFSDKRDEGDGIFSYQVQDNQYGQLAVRRIIDTHWGKDANPWCLTTRGEYQWETTPEYREWLQTQDLGWRGLEHLTAHGTLDEDDDRMFKWKYKRETGKSAEVRDDGLSTARRLWLHYSSLPKRIAFRNGKLLAFMATEDAKKFGELWWDRNNKDHPSVHDCV